MNGVTQAEFDAHKQDVAARFDQLLTVAETNTRAVEQLVAETQSVIQLSRDIQGVARVGVRIQKFGLWVIKWPVIGVGCYSMFHWLMDRLPG